MTQPTLDTSSNKVSPWERISPKLKINNKKLIGESKICEVYMGKYVAPTGNISVAVKVYDLSPLTEVEQDAVVKEGEVH